MRYRFHTVDVFTAQRFGGNPLAVLPDARGLDGEQMQAITREFNFSESTFVLPPEDPANDARVRIFTPVRELPFAGHPNVGTAFVLSTQSASGIRDLRFEEGAGLVPVSVQSDDAGRIYCELTAPQTLELGEGIGDAATLEVVASALGLDASDIAHGNHAPCAASVGLDFLMVEVTDASVLGRIQMTAELWRQAEAATGCHAVLVYAQASSDADLDVRARMFTLMQGIVEDPATGSANCALAGLLASLDPLADGCLRYRVAQGVEMGRPSLLQASVDKRDGQVVAVRIGGNCVPVTEGWLQID